MISRSDSSGGHILISGTGRAGTTLLVKYFTVLGFGTGFSVETAMRTEVGLERVATKEPLPYVIKSPHYSQIIGSCLDRETLRINCCVIPVRRLFDAAESRRRVHREAVSSGKSPNQSGTLWMTDVPDEQETVLAFQFYGLIETLSRHKVSMYFLHFPEFAESADALYDGLNPLLTEHGVSREESSLAHQKVVDLRLVHSF